MRFQILLLCFLCLGYEVSAQADSDPDTLVGKAYRLSDAHPDQALRIGEHLLSNTVTSAAQRCDVEFLMAKSWFAKGRYDNSLAAAFRAGKLAQNNASRLRQSEISLLIASVLRTLQLDDQCEKYLRLAKWGLSTARSADGNGLAMSLLNQKALLALDREDYDSALTAVSDAKRIAERLPQRDRKALSETFFAEAAIHLAQKRYDEAETSCLKSLELLGDDDRSSQRYLSVVNALAAVRFQQKRHRDAVGLLLTALPIAEKLGHRPLRQSLDRRLALNYLALGNQRLYRFYNQGYLKGRDAVDKLESESTNVAFSLISREQEMASDSYEAGFARYAYVALSAAIFAMLCLAVLSVRNRSRSRRYEEIRNYLELGTKAANPVAGQIRKEPARNLAIPAETEQNLLAKLRKFETSNRFTNKEMSLAFLAAQFDTNTKYLSEIINRHGNANFNTYINRLRIAYIIDKLKSEPKYRQYKISYLADESGFSSHSSFATTFKSITGIAPTTFIELLNDETQKTKR